MRGGLVVGGAVLGLVVGALALATEARAAALHTNTESVTGLVRDGDVAWVATTGGLERYQLAGAVTRQLYTTADGLADNALVGVALEQGVVVARSREARCTLDAAQARFTCAAAPVLAPPLPVGERFADARVTARAEGLVGTAGAGVWLVPGGPAAPHRLTPDGQICSNHIVSMARFGGRLWLGSFDEGLCAWDGMRFSTPRVPFRRVNDLVATPHGMVIAASEGLFFTADGARFTAVRGVRARGFNDLALASDGTVLATTPGALFELRVTARGARLRSERWRPGTATAVQAVAAGERGERWLAAEDRGAVQLVAGQAPPRLFDRAAGLPTSWALDVAVLRGGDVLVATLRHGLVRITKDGRAEVVPGSAGAWLLHVSTSPDGRTAWVGAQGGLFRYTGGRLVPAGDALPNDCVHAVFVDGTSLWIATEGGLVVRPV